MTHFDWPSGLALSPVPLRGGLSGVGLGVPDLVQPEA